MADPLLLTIRQALRMIGYEMPTTERNPDGDEQAAHSMQLVARDALAACDALEARMKEFAEPFCDEVFRARLLRQGLSNDEMAQYVEAVEDMQVRARAVLPGLPAKDADD